MIALVVVAAVIALVWWWRSTPDARSPDARSPVDPVRTRSAERAKIPPLRRDGRVRLSMPPPAVAEIEVPALCAHGTGASDDWWACLPRDPTWDATREGYLLDRISRHVGLELAADRLECRARCCRLRITGEEQARYGGDLGSSVGLVVGPTDGYLRTPVDPSVPDGDLVVTTCWQPGDLDDYPDRAVEREIVIAEASAALDGCATLPGAPAESSLLIMLDDDGAIDTISHGTSMPRPVMECISAALREVGVFEPPPSPMARSIPMRLRLRREI